MTKNEIIERMRDGLDEMVAAMGEMSSPEWANLTGIRFMENYRIMRVLEKHLEVVE